MERFAFRALPHRPKGQCFTRKLMKKDEIREILTNDINSFRLKAEYYKSIHLFEAAKYADELASNIELALTTMGSDSDTEIA